jgi:hypothetical protein
MRSVILSNSVALTFVLTFLAGCSSGTSQSPATRTEQLSTAVPTRAATYARVATPTPGPPLTLRDVRVVPSGDQDQVLFTFDGPVPPDQIDFLETTPTDCASGAPVQIAGQIWLQIRFTPAVAHDDAENPTLSTTVIHTDLLAVLEAAQTCDRDGTVTWVLGLPQLLGVGWLLGPPNAAPQNVFMLSVNRP